MTVKVTNAKLTWDQVVKHHRDLNFQNDSVISTVLKSPKDTLYKRYAIKKIEPGEHVNNKENLCLTLHQLDDNGDEIPRPRFLNGKMRIDGQFYNVTRLLFEMADIDPYFNELAETLKGPFPKVLVQIIFDYIVYHNTPRCKSPILQIT